MSASSFLTKALKKAHQDGYESMTFYGLVDENLFEWCVTVTSVPGDSAYSGAMLRLGLEFPESYPNSPPVLRVLSEGFVHPNVYKDGRVCMSILHEAKEDPTNTQELMSEKWRPTLALSVHAIVLSFMSTLGDPNFESPANIDVSVEWKNDPATFKRCIRRFVRQTQGC